MKFVSVVVTMEGDVQVKKGQQGTDYVTGVGVGMEGARVAFTFFWRSD